MYNRDDRGRFASRSAASGAEWLNATADDRTRLNECAAKEPTQPHQLADAAIVTFVGPSQVLLSSQLDCHIVDPDLYVSECLRTESPEYPNRRTSRIVHAILGLMDEVGELAKALKSHFHYGTDLDLDNLGEEAGDLAWYLALLSDAIGIPLSRIMAANLAKLRARYPDKFTTDNAVSRNLEAEKAAMKETH